MPEPPPTSIFACLPKTTRGMPIVLGGDPKGKNFLYTNGNSVIIRDIDNPEICDMYTEHSQPTTVAKYSPSGFYIASGDVSGKLRIWDTTQKEHILKNEFQPFAGTIKDIAWTGDSQRIAACGEGREKFGHVFSADTGTSVGEIMGHSKTINSCDFRPDRPMRLVTAGEDSNVVFFQGPPFRFEKSIKDHTRFVNCVRYHPKGDVFITGGAEGKAFIYDGKTAEAKGELGSPAHKGGIYGLSFNGDGSKVVTVSGDKTAKIWDVATASVVTEFSMGSAIEDMQVGCLWQGPHVLSVSLSGHINYLDQNNPGTPLRVLHGHNKPITALTVMADKTTAFTGSSDGIICSWNLSNGVTQTMKGKGHTSQVQDMTCQGDDLISCGMDDNLVFSSASNREYKETIKMPSQPRSVAASSGGLLVVACIKDLVVLRDHRVVYSHPVDYEPVSVAVHPGMTEVAVGSGQDHKVHLYTLAGDTLADLKTLDVATGNVSTLSYSPDGAYLATGDSNRKVVLYQLPGYESTSSTGYSLHQARVNCMAWSADSTRFATGALDTNILAWSPTDVMNPAKVKGAHPLSQVSRLAFLDTNRVVSAGHDSSIRQWTL